MIFEIFQKSPERMFVDQIPIWKKSSRFSNSNFRRQKIIHKKLSFFLFLQKNWKKIHIYGKEEYRSKEKNELNFSTSSLWKSNRNYRRKKLFKVNGEKNLYSQNFWRIFAKLSEIMSLAFSRWCPKHRKHPSNISANACRLVEKSDF